MVIEEGKATERTIFITIDFLYIIKIFQKRFRSYIRLKKKPKGKIIETATKKINDFKYVGNQMTQPSNISMFLVGRMNSELEESYSRNKIKSLEVEGKYTELFKNLKNAAITQNKEDSRVEEVMDDVDVNLGPTFQENEILKLGKKLQTMASIGVNLSKESTPIENLSQKFMENFEVIH